MCQQRGIKVERQGKANNSTTPRTALSFRRAALGGIRSNDTAFKESALQCLCYTTWPVVITWEMVSGIVYTVCRW